MKALLSIFLLLTFGACVWGFTPEQIAEWKEAAENGDAEAQVIEILGEPKKVSATPDVSTIQPDLITPKVINGDPRPGKRVFQALPGYELSNVRHALYLPTDWETGKSYPVIAEYTGNNGTVTGGKAAQGYGISGGKAFIWVTLPFVSADGTTDMDWWWGDPDRTASYAVKAVESICKNWGGNPKAVILTGHSRGAIACNYIGLRNDKIAKLWLGMVPVSHYDNRRWGQTETEQARRVERLLRLGNTSQYVCGEYHLTENHKDQKLLSLVQEGKFTTLAQVKRQLNIESILDQEGIRSYILQNHPTAKVTFNAFPWVNHYGDWILRNTPSREKLRSWVHDLVDSTEPELSSKYGTLIFHDTFDRTESQELKDEPGNEWTTSSDKTAKGYKEVDLRDGHVYIYTHAEANHATSFRHAFEFKDGTLGLRFMFEDEDDTLTLNFADLDLKTVWAGHLFKITIGTKDVALIDQKTGQMDLTIRDVRKEGTITKELEALVVSKSVTLPNKLKTNKWHQVYATIKSDELTCTIDGKFVGRFRSEGFAHETKKLLRLLVAKNAYVDDVKIWRRK